MSLNKGRAYVRDCQGVETNELVSFVWPNCKWTK